MLIESDRYTRRDLEVWRRLERYDQRLAHTQALEGRINEALGALRDFDPRP